MKREKIELTTEEKKWAKVIKNYKEENGFFSRALPVGDMPRKSWGNPNKQRLYLENNIRTRSDYRFYLRHDILNIFKDRVNFYRKPKFPKFSQDKITRFKKAFVQYVNKNGFKADKVVFGRKMKEHLKNLFGDFEVIHGYGSNECYESRTTYVKNGTQYLEIEYGTQYRCVESYKRKGWIGKADNFNNIFSYPEKITKLILKNRKGETVKLFKGAYKEYDWEHLLDYQKLPYLKRKISNSENPKDTLNEIIKSLRFDFSLSKNIKKLMIENLKQYCERNFTEAV